MRSVPILLLGVLLDAVAPVATSVTRPATQAGGNIQTTLRQRLPEDVLTRATDAG
jgi:hypothetical protein